MGPRTRSQNEMHAPYHTTAEKPRHQHLMAKYQAILHQQEKAASRARSVIDAIISGFFVVASFIWPAVQSHFRVMPIFNRIESLLAFIGDNPAKLMSILATVLIIVFLVLMLSWIWWFCRYSLGWMLSRILISILFRLAASWIPIGIPRAIGEDLVPNLTTILVKLGGLAVFGSSVFLAWTGLYSGGMRFTRRKN
ncbi:Fc.00g082360.m01.CDS01 [Cosmosporella sp. VM-42]